jgi:hypothetical protein
MITGSVLNSHIRVPLVYLAAVNNHAFNNSGYNLSDRIIQQWKLTYSKYSHFA